MIRWRYYPTNGSLHPQILSNLIESRNTSCKRNLRCPQRRPSQRLSALPFPPSVAPKAWQMSPKRVLWRRIHSRRPLDSIQPCSEEVQLPGTSKGTASITFSRAPPAFAYTYLPRSAPKKGNSSNNFHVLNPSEMVGIKEAPPQHPLAWQRLEAGRGRAAAMVAGH